MIGCNDDPWFSPLADKSSLPVVVGQPAGESAWVVNNGAKWCAEVKMERSIYNANIGQWSFGLAVTFKSLIHCRQKKPNPIRKLRSAFAHSYDVAMQIALHFYFSQEWTRKSSGYSVSNKLLFMST